ncbi:hypothetical protein [Burkholderia dolosa]|uniref:hypothetical protein n=1 Tax=Burkholderia dolosa TaxID=152500 RepID=UPI00167F6BD4|nr:hypothetical protein [Burkholderia dolosa]
MMTIAAWTETAIAPNAKAVATLVHFHNRTQTSLIGRRADSGRSFVERPESAYELLETRD